MEASLESLMVVEELFRLDGGRRAASKVCGYADASLMGSADGVIDAQSDAQPMGSSTGSVCSEEGSVSNSGTGESIKF
jgi:hypothetical protein